MRAPTTASDEPVTTLEAGQERNTRSAVLLILPRDVVDRARVLAGKATTQLKLPVSLQIVLRALIHDGLRRGDHVALRATVASEALAVRERRAARRRDARPEPRVPGRALARKER